jgi:alkanesulfonate monooxygenase SsuD/methylene tetrahydromethanopterin reductase-like flavin-dependent oxidoreductase (luciferase family)
MRFGLYTLNLGPSRDPQDLVQLARDADAAGWDGFFVSENLSAPGGQAGADSWTTLAAIAVQTTRIRLGPLVTVLPRRHLGQLARAAITLDHLSEGRLVQGVGSGDDAWREDSTFGAVPDARQRGAMLDEALEVVTGLWSGRPFSFQGTYYHIDAAQFLPPPVQQPRIPIWVGGSWPHPRPFRRAARWDGVYPNALERELEPEDYQAIRAYIGQHRTSTTAFDMVHAHPVSTPQDVPGRDRLRAYQAVGVTWWLAYFDWTCSLDTVRQYIRQGPPSL